MGRLHKRKYLCKNFGAKEKEGVCPKGAYFQELTVYVQHLAYDRYH